MLISSRLLNSPLTRISYGVVHAFKRNRKSLFDFTQYNQNWLPRIKPYHKKRRPRQAAWTEPSIDYPQLIPPMHPRMNPRHYMKTIENEQKQKIQRRRDFLVGDIRAGDLVQITYQQTFESEDLVKYKALVIGMTKRNSLMAGMVVIIRLGGINIQSHYPIHSPKIRNIEIISRGSGTLKSRMYYLWDSGNMTKNAVNTAIKNKSSSRRKDDYGFEASQSHKIKNLVTDQVTNVNQQK